jgi:hypothetical protein
MHAPHRAGELRGAIVAMGNFEGVRARSFAPGSGT